MPFARLLDRLAASRWLVGCGAAGILALSGLAAVTGSADMVDTELDFCTMSLAFEDEFDTLSIAARDARAARWTAHTPWNGDFGDATFADPGGGSPFAVRNGVLSITASKDANGHWTSGLIASTDAETHGFSQRYGYFEARMKLPRGPGLWPAFWLGTNEPRARQEPSIEIDVIEHYGHAPGVFKSVVHVWEKAPLRNTEWSHEVAVPDGFLYDSFHLFGVKVTPAFITTYLDRKPIWQIATPDIHRMPLLMLVNLALGSGFAIDKTPNPSVLEVDYVRAYAFDPAGGQKRCPG
jgi:beta-glucanase (GH16 family)